MCMCAQVGGYVHSKVSVHRVQKEGIRSQGAGVAGGCEIPCESWEPNLGPLQEQQGLLTAEPSLQPLNLRMF